MKTPLAENRVVFRKMGWAMDFVGCEDIVAALPKVFRGWQIASGPTEDFRSYNPRSTITRHIHGWNWKEHGAPKPRDWDRIPPRTSMRVITDVHSATIHWFLDANPDLLCLHGGAVKIGQGLVCFPAKGRTGKSTLIANLAAHGHEIFCDDVLGLAPLSERGVSLGLQPRLRVPLAPVLNKAVRKFVAAHSGPMDASWHYLKLGKGQLAGLGQSAPIKAFVILERRDGGPAELSKAGTAEVLKDIIAENIIRKLPMAVIFERLHRLASTRQRLRLRYSDPNEAALLLAREFS